MAIKEEIKEEIKDEIKEEKNSYFEKQKVYRVIRYKEGLDQAQSILERELNALADLGYRVKLSINNGNSWPIVIMELQGPMEDYR